VIASNGARPSARVEMPWQKRAHLVYAGHTERLHGAPPNKNGHRQPSAAFGAVGLCADFGTRDDHAAHERRSATNSPDKHTSTRAAHALRERAWALRFRWRCAVLHTWPVSASATASP